MRRCSSFSKARRTSAYVNRFVQNAKRSKQKGAITVEEFKKAEMQLYHWSQSELDVNTLNKQISLKVGDDGIIQALGVKRSLCYNIHMHVNRSSSSGIGQRQ